MNECFVFWNWALPVKESQADDAVPSRNDILCWSVRIGVVAEHYAREMRGSAKCSEYLAVSVIPIFLSSIHNADNLAFVASGA